MKTYEMVALAQEDGCTYIVNDIRYNREQGFHDKDGDEWCASAWNKSGLQVFVLYDGWKKVEVKEITMKELRKIVGYDFVITK